MLLPTHLDTWFAEALTRVYVPWLTSTCVGIGDRQRREVAELVQRARRAACLPPLEHGDAVQSSLDVVSGSPPASDRRDLSRSSVRSPSSGGSLVHATGGVGVEIV